jgi:ribosomal protein S18 acetylase RimI-like enzyme
MAENITIQRLSAEDFDWAENLWIREWGADYVVSRGKTHHLRDLDGFVAWTDTQRVGLLTYRADGPSIEIVTLYSFVEEAGIGTALVNKCINEAKKRKCKRIWLITTNDNIDALKFYQRRGFVMHALHKREIEHSRKMKPSIPQVGNYGIPIRDEIELEYIL